MTIRRKIIPLYAVLINLLTAEKNRLAAAARQTPSGWTIAHSGDRTYIEQTLSTDRVLASTHRL
jgi:hypothetical protein